MNLDELLALKAQRTRPITVVHCGSTTRAREAFAEWQLKDTLAGKKVFTIGAHKNDSDLGITPEQAIELDILHLSKIDDADEVLILNVGGYVGESTRRELEYAQRLGKQIRWLEPPMQFRLVLITILDGNKQPTIEVEAWQGVGTGLAYHHPVDEDGKQLNNEFSLTHIPTGMALSRLTLPTEGEAMVWLAAVAALDEDQWNISEEQYMQRYYYSGRVREMCAQVELAHRNALIPRDEYMLFPEDADGEPNDDIVEAQSGDPEDSSTRETVARLFSYSQSTVRVILASFNQTTGKHTDLHTYERSTAVEARI